MSLTRRTFNRLVVRALAASSPALAGAGCAAPGPSRVASPSGGCGGVTSGLVVLAEFPDVPHTVQRRWAQQRFSRELADYAAEMSYGAARLQFDITERWHVLPRPVSQYAISPRNLEVDKTRVRRLIDDAVNAVDRATDFSRLTSPPSSWAPSARSTG